MLTLEAHGRRDDIDGLDVTRTVGWFTAHYPIAVHDDPDPGSTLKSVKEALRTTPGGGTGYLALRHLDHDDEIRRQAQPEIIVNYLGRALDRPRDAVFTLVPEEPVGSRHADDDRLFPIEVVASVVGGALVIECRYSPAAHDRATMARLVDEIRTSLISLVGHCCDAGIGGFTPSDFPEAGLDQGALDEFLAEL
jgi:non-ribosomal peptide synthase protein (TIGR01720 family)